MAGRKLSTHHAHTCTLVGTDRYNYFPFILELDVQWFSLLVHKYEVCSVDLKNPQPESWELSFIWGEIRTQVWETTSQVALRNCSKEARGEARIYEFLQKKRKVVGTKDLQLTRFTEKGFRENQFLWEDVNVWLTGITPLIGTIAVGQSLFLSWVPSGLSGPLWEGCSDRGP